MTTAPVSHHHPYHDENARAYLQSLQQGQKPDIRPEFGHWEEVVKKAEQIFDQTKKGSMVTARLQSLIKTQKYPGLKELLAGKTVPRQTTPKEPLAPVEQPETEQGGMPALPEAAQLAPALAQGACYWLDRYAAFSEEVSPEGYKDFHEDCGIFTLAAISGRRVRVGVGNGEYTPLSIALVAKPGTYAKSTTAEVSPTVLRAAGLHWILGSDETTPQKLLTDMAGQHVPKQYSRFDEARKETFKQRQAMAAQVAWYCDEFGELVKSINKATGPMSDLKKLILKFDNCPRAYTTSTVARGREEIEKPFLSFLGVMTPASIKKSAQSQSEEWGDGFWSRFVFSCAPDDDGLDKPFGPSIPVPASLSEPLRDYHEWLGEPEIEVEELKDKKGEQVIDYRINRLVDLPEVVIDHLPIAAHWTTYRSALKKILKTVPEDLKASYIRLPTRALRVAALLASFEGLDHIELKHWAKAQEIAERWRFNLHRFYAQINSAEDKPNYAKSVEEKVLAYIDKFSTEIEDKDKIPTLRNMSRYIKNVDIKSLRGTVIDLKQAEVLVEKKKEGGKAVYYVRGELEG